MACAAEHAQFNFLAVMTATAFLRSPEGDSVGAAPVVMGAAAALMPSLPDWFEPAVHPNHRKFFHSFAMAALVAIGLHRAYKWEPETDLQKLLRFLALAGGAAYLAHLARDAFTAKSLPLI